ncbi:hypothetical protein BU26DRAFT_77048 [Trematosphaeria pertusa]|uniref:Uncharacterized protein n=1 Tax=Trematosphaeria pertusa TaxID=390896 RepID=A0A6A6I3N8_9PLEO|nr:uncharacterized protein BU26DRAFT_77048 [Trematosphaeria pertusa]KAF2245114.1 hypothetical protein BU26DRAFT_77048 [Trematosphaeria pertusa]
MEPNWVLGKMTSCLIRAIWRMLRWKATRQRRNQQVHAAAVRSGSILRNPRCRLCRPVELVHQMRSLIIPSRRHRLNPGFAARIACKDKRLESRRDVDPSSPLSFTPILQLPPTYKLRGPISCAHVQPGYTGCSQDTTKGRPKRKDDTDSFCSGQAGSDHFPSEEHSDFLIYVQYTRLRCSSW